MNVLKAILALGLLLPAFANAGIGHEKGQIEWVRTHDPVGGNPDWAPPVFWFTLKGIDTVNGCPKWNDKVLFVMNSEQAYSTVLAAYMGNKEISIRYDTGKKHLGVYCIAVTATLGDAPPLF